MYKSFKIRLELNNKQKTLAEKHSGVARHAYNWGVDIIHSSLNENFKLFNDGKDPLKLPSSIDLHKRLVAEVKKENNWYYEVSKCSPQESLRNVEKSLKNYFRKIKNGDIQKLKDNYLKNNKNTINYDYLNNIGKPKFKKKGQHDSFYLEGNIKICGDKIKLPIFGIIKMSEKLHIDDNIKNCVISKLGNQWFVAFKTIYNKRTENTVKKSSVGVDLGIKTLATLSNNIIFNGSRPYKKFKHKLKIEQRKLSKKYNKNEKKQSKNYVKQRNVISKLHNKISNIRKDEINKLTTYLSKNHGEVVIEDLNVSGMVKNHKLASAILDGGFYEFKRQLEYKCLWYGSVLTIIDRWYPSSKTCSNCNNIKKDLKLSHRVYDCLECGFSSDRDLNASINLNKKAVSYTV